MPTLYHQSSPTNSMTNSINISSKYHQSVSHLGGLFQSRELTLVRHIEALKCAANAPLLFPDLNNSARPNASFLSIENSGEKNDLSSLKSRPHSTNWAIDPSQVPGNLRQNADKNKEESILTVEEIISRGSSVSDKAAEYESGIHSSKSRVKSRRKFTKSVKKKAAQANAQAVSTSNNNRQGPFSTHPKLSRGPQHTSKSIDCKDLNALTALCKGITIQEKVPYSIYSKPSPVSTKNSSGTENAKAAKNGALPHGKKVHTSSEKPLVARGRPLHRDDDVKIIKVFQSDQQSGVISDLGLLIPCAPPATPTPEQLRKVEYVPSLQDVRAQRAFRHRLQVMETKASQKEMRKQESQAAADKLTLKEKKMQHKKLQRQQIYALNKVMTDLEHDRFHSFMQGVGSGRV